MSATSTKRELSDKFYSEVKRQRSRYPADRNQAMLIPALHMAQKEKGWISEAVMDEIAAAIDIPPPVVREVVTFYTWFNLKPVGKYHLQFCSNISCCLLGSDELLEHCEEKLGIEVGETTKDNRFTLSHVECLGSCGTAPVLQINEDYHENMSAEKFDALLGTLK